MQEYTLGSWYYIILGILMFLFIGKQVSWKFAIGATITVVTFIIGVSYDKSGGFLGLSFISGALTFFAMKDV